MNVQAPARGQKAVLAVVFLLYGGAVIFLGIRAFRAIDPDSRRTAALVSQPIATLVFGLLLLSFGFASSLWFATRPTASVTVRKSAVLRSLTLIFAGFAVLLSLSGLKWLAAMAAFAFFAAWGMSKMYLRRAIAGERRANDPNA